jgi:hypothetical protein
VNVILDLQFHKAVSYLVIDISVNNCVKCYTVRIKIISLHSYMQTKIIISHINYYLQS